MMPVAAPVHAAPVTTVASFNGTTPSGGAEYRCRVETVEGFSRDRHEMRAGQLSANRSQ